MTNMVNPIRIRIELAVMDPDLDHTGIADPDPEALTKLTNKTVLLPFKKALYLLRKVHIFFAYNLLYCSTQYFSYINSTFWEFKV